MAIKVATEIRQSSLSELREEAGLLLVEHHCEVVKDRELMRLKPDWDRYQYLEDSDMLLILTAWASEEIIGYCVCIMTSHLHYADLQVCTCDALFVHEEARRSRGVGLRLMEVAEEIAHENGCEAVFWAAPVGSRMNQILDGLNGYQKREVVYQKRL